MENFVNKYSLSKTLRFELIPQGKTKEYIDAKGLLKQDADRADSYQKVKKKKDHLGNRKVFNAATQLFESVKCLGELIPWNFKVTNDPYNIICTAGFPLMCY